MGFRVLFAGVIIGILLQANAALAQEVYLCKPDDPRSAGNWVAPEVGIAYKPGDKTASVDDAIIQTFSKGPKEAKVETDNAKRTTFMWTVRMQNGTDHTTMIYRLTIMKAGFKATFAAIPQGYSNTFHAQGKCEKIKG